MAHDPTIITFEGVESWNKWREENPDIIPDLHGESFVGQDMENINFENVNLEGADLTEACLIGANLKHANLTDAQLIKTNFQGADLADAQLVGAAAEGAILSNANFKRANLMHADLEQALMISTVFVDSELSAVNFHNSYPVYADISGAKLINANFRGAVVNNIKYDPKRLECSNIVLDGCHGSQGFISAARSNAYVAEVKERLDPRMFWLWWITSDCGRSPLRFAGSVLFFAAFFGIAYANYEVWGWLPDSIKWLLDFINPEFGTRIDKTWFSPYYFSIVSLTTLGFGDITPQNAAGELWLTLEVLIGYVMLGILVTFFTQKR